MLRRWRDVLTGRRCRRRAACARHEGDDGKGQEWLAHGATSLGSPGEPGSRPRGGTGGPAGPGETPPVRHRAAPETPSCDGRLREDSYMEPRIAPSWPRIRAVAPHTDTPSTT